MSKKELEKIAISETVMDDIEGHCFSEVSHEVGGFLVGTIGEAVTEIVGIIPSTKAQSQRTSLTFTHEAWDEAYQALSSKFPNQSLVGWYHSHPGFGVFMSEYDAFIQQNFFGTQGQLALVVDPLSGRRGWFKWSNEHIKSIHEEDTKKEALGGEAADYAPPKAREIKTPMESSAVLRLVLTVLIMLLAGAAGYASGKSTSSLENEKLQSQASLLKLQIDGVANSLVSKLFYAIQDNDPTPQKIYVRYALSDFEKSQENWLAIVANKFGVSNDEIAKLNPTSTKDKAAPNYVNVPVIGWSSIPPAVKEKQEAQVSESPTATASPSPSKS